MSTRVVDRVDDWDEQPFSGGYRTLHELADENVSGVIRAGGAELYMTRGTVVGIERGSIDDFEAASGTTYEAPSPALPLLAVMQAADADVRAKYYSEKTAISEVDRTLSDGGFSGFVELSENVLSGDYYLVYHAGNSMSVGFVGASSRLIDGDEAFETADDEVGIYKVRQVDVDAIEIPEPTGSAGGAAGGTATGTDGAVDRPGDGGTRPSTSGTGTTAETADRPGETTGQREVTRQEPDENDRTVESDSAGAEADRDTARESAGSHARADTESDRARADTESDHARADTESDHARADTESDHARTDTESDHARTDTESDHARADTESDRARTDTESDHAQADAESDHARADTESDHAQADTESDHTRADTKSGQSAGRDGAAGSTGERSSSRETAAGTGAQRGDQQGRREDRSSGERGIQPSAAGRAERASHVSSTATAGAESFDLETRAVPSLDPEQTEPTRQKDRGARGDSLERGREPAAETAPRAPPRETQPPQTQPAQSTEQDEEESATAGSAETQQSQDPATAERIEELETEIEQRDEEIGRLESELDRTETEKADLETQLETAREERDELAEKVEELEEELGRLEEELGAATDAERRMTATEALTGTDVFIRYYSKGDATLEKAHGGSHRNEDVNDNLDLEKHTQFDASSASVGGQSYAEFLEGTLEYQFVEWVVRDLLFEIRDTGHDSALKDLYDALPQVDRAELSGAVDVVYAEEGQETRSQESFDVILRNRMGNPLMVANLNDSREAATESMMENLITAAERVGQSSDEFACALLVTRSFFDPDALEMASDATQGGLLSRDKRKSFVNLSRKRGYHLCLVEARNQNFHLAVPEL